MLPSTRSAKAGVTATALQSSAIHSQRSAAQEPVSPPALGSAPPALGAAPPVKQWEWAGFAQLPTHIVREATWYDQERTLPALFEDVPEGGIVWMSFANAASLRPSRRGLTRALARRSSAASAVASAASSASAVASAASAASSASAVASAASAASACGPVCPPHAARPCSPPLRVLAGLRDTRVQLGGARVHAA